MPCTWASCWRLYVRVVLEALVRIVLHLSWFGPLGCNSRIQQEGSAGAQVQAGWLSKGARQDERAGAHLGVMLAVVLEFWRELHDIAQEVMR